MDTQPSLPPDRVNPPLSLDDEPEVETHDENDRDLAAEHAADGQLSLDDEPEVETHDENDRDLAAEHAAEGQLLLDDEPEVETHDEPDHDLAAEHAADGPLHIAFLNKSTLVGEADFAKWVIACADQARNHAAPLWGWPMPVVEFLPDESAIRPEHDLIYLFDDADAAGALGYHDVTPSGQPYAKVFARDCLENGTAISSCMSHETLELLGDPSADMWADAPDGYQYAVELCDAVQEFSYHLDGVEVSDFVLPSFFGGPGTSRVDYLSKLTGEFQTGAGGYQIRRDPKTGAVDQVFGFGHFKEWRLKGKKHPAARTYRRGVR